MTIDVWFFKSKFNQTHVCDSFQLHSLRQGWRARLVLARAPQKQRKSNPLSIAGSAGSAGIAVAGCRQPQTKCALHLYSVFASLALIVLVALLVFLCGCLLLVALLWMQCLFACVACIACVA